MFFIGVDNKLSSKNNGAKLAKKLYITYFFLKNLLKKDFFPDSL